MDLGSITKELEERMKGATPARKVKFDLGPDGVILVDGQANPPTLSQTDGDADVTLTLSAGDLQNILDGSLDPQTAFMSGRLAVDGDMALAMQLAQTLS